jgi:hypothetical protein
METVVRYTELRAKGDVDNEVGAVKWFPLVTKRRAEWRTMRDFMSGMSRRL